LKSNYKPLGDYIKEVNIRNRDNKVTKLLGVSMEKTFIPSVANVTGVDLSVYKVLKKNQLACKLMSVGRDEKLPVDLYKEDEDAMVSSAYYVFEPKNNEELLPEFLMMWLCRSENDRYIGFISGGDVRGGISWETFCSLPIKVPSIHKQREIVKEYNIIQDRINLNKQLIQKLEETAQTIYKEWFVDFEFPNKNGKPYKSNGGEMVWCDELEKEVPIDWKIVNLGKILDTINGYAFKSEDFKDNGAYPIIKIKNIKAPYVYIQSDTNYYDDKLSGNLQNITANKGDILISMTGSGANQINSAVGQVGIYYYNITSLINQRVCKLQPKKDFYSQFLFQFVSSNDIQTELLNGSTGSANQANISPNQIKDLKILIPNENILKAYSRIALSIDNFKSLEMLDKFEEMKDLLLSKLASV
jgi:type I restriction enzyme S subunit